MKNTIFAILTIMSFAGMAQVKQHRSVQTLEELQNENDSTVLSQRLKNLEDGSESDLNLLMQYYDRKDKLKKQTVLLKLVKKYPKSEAAFYLAQNDLYFEKSLANKETIALKLKSEFPTGNYDQLNGLLAMGAANEKNTEKALSYFKGVKHPFLRAITLGNIIDKLSDTEMNSALVLASQEMPAIKKLPSYTPGVYDNVLNSSVLLTKNTGVRGKMIGVGEVYYDLINKYGQILYKAGKNEEALRYIREAYTELGAKDDHLSKVYGDLLILSGNYKDALSVLSGVVLNGKADDKINNAVKTAYSKLNPGKNASNYLSSLDSTYLDKYRRHLLTLLVNQPAPEFSLKDVNGKTVSLSDFKGKTVIIDFWATWCGPCKASFPAMQIAVNKYKDDPNVKFLFVHTLEKVANPVTDASSYLNSNNYNFDLFFDFRDAETKKCPAVTAFDVKGIPTKFIIDAKGNVRFKVTGYSYNIKGTADEVIQMIEILKKEV